MWRHFSASSWSEAWWRRERRKLVLIILNVLAFFLSSLQTVSSNDTVEQAPRKLSPEVLRLKRSASLWWQSVENVLRCHASKALTALGLWLLFWLASCAVERGEKFKLRGKVKLIRRMWLVKSKLPSTMKIPHQTDDTRGLHPSSCYTKFLS